MRDITQSVLARKTANKKNNLFIKGRKLAFIFAFSIGLLGVGSAFAFNSGDKPSGTGDDTITWTGQGATNGVLNSSQCDEQNDPNGANQPYLLWVFTTDGGSATITGTGTQQLKLGGTGSGSYEPDTNTGNTFKFVTPYFTPDSSLTATLDFNVVTTGNGAWNLVISHGCVGKASPTISTTPNPTTATIGDILNDTATLSGGNNPIGNVVFSLFAPSDPTCAGTPAYTETDSSAPYATTTGFASNAVGTWHWTAHYAGDTNNNPADSLCADEAVTVNKATPTLTTNASGPVIVGNDITDTAHLSGGYGTLTGSITFDVFLPGDTTCSTPVSVTPSRTVNGAGDYTSGNYTTTAVGDYRWIAHYSGDTNNNAVDTSCNDANETSTVNKATPTIGTTPNPTAGVLGVTLNDSATVSGGYNPTGTVTFNLYGPLDTNCSGTPAYTQTVNLSSGSAATSPGFASNAVGTWRWTATYNGDSNNNTATSGCQDELVTVTQPLWCSPGFWATALKQNRMAVLAYLSDKAGGLNLYNTYYSTVLGAGGAPLKKSTQDPATTSLATVLLNPQTYGGPAFNSVANYIASRLGWGGTQATGENCPLNANGVPTTTLTTL